MVLGPPSILPVSWLTASIGALIPFSTENSPKENVQQVLPQGGSVLNADIVLRAKKNS
jgi:hypothetical protein